VTRFLNPADIMQALIRNIEIASVAMENGRCGYVLHTIDFLEFVCDGGRGMCLDLPFARDTVVTTLREASQLQMRWNQGPSQFGVVISLRRDAITGYINAQRALLEVLTREAVQ